MRSSIMTLVLIRLKLGTHELSSLCRVSRELNQVAFPILYEAITVNFAHSEESGWSIDCSDSPQQVLNKYMGHVKTILVKVRSVGQERSFRMTEVYHIEKDSLDEVTPRLREPLDSLPKTSLRGFKWVDPIRHGAGSVLTKRSWRVDGYLPDRVFEALSHLLSDKSQLQKLSVTNSAPYLLSNRETSVTQLPESVRLQRLECHNVVSHYMFSAVWNSIAQNCSHLITLSIGVHNVRDISSLVSPWDPIDFSHPDLADEQYLLLSQLRHLRLENFRLDESTATISQAFNFRGLQSLKLRECFQVEKFLVELAETVEPYPLLCLELSQDHGSYDDSDSPELNATLIKALSNLPLLKDLYLRLRSFTVWRQLIEEILQPHSLRNLVFHNRGRECSRWRKCDHSPCINASFIDKATECVGVSFPPLKLVSFPISLVLHANLIFND